ncbi:hypercellular protein HypA [Moelleriella libera RCEF 2490]|uniref:aminodeoxychorismate synthase n=1 Tax=Moelleriella libera RCEF 2490 TaxID=1081109 RepID=A0A167ZPQ6_9HYPO|nr:hypercellular protein HypA [Moelleriella libera RCEF 2490]
MGINSTAHTRASAPAATSYAERSILFLDAYDSFTNNIVSLLKDALGTHVKVHVLHMDLKTLTSDPAPDWTEREFLERLADFDAVVCGPGPGSPLNEADVGAFRLLWRLAREQQQCVPVLGICLGFQSLVEHFGGKIRRLRRGLHGMVRDIDHVRDVPADIFDRVPPFKATLYHSLCADIGQDAIAAQEWHEARWLASAQAPDLLPLAWALETGSDDDDDDDGGGERTEPERILMAVRHARKPFWGLQYHPESVCTDAAAARGVIVNWFHQALKWNEATRRKVRRPASVLHLDSLGPSLHHALEDVGSGQRLSSCLWWQDLQSGLARHGIVPGYSCRKMKLPEGVDTAELAEVLGLDRGSDSIILDSSSTITGDPLARNSIIALGVDEALRLEYHVGDNYMTLKLPATAGRKEESQRIRLGKDVVDPWSPWHVISEFWRWRTVPQDEFTPAFKGGFMGFVSYEMGLSTLSPGLVPARRPHHRPDLCMAWVSRSIVLDHQAGYAYIQGLTTADNSSSDDSWIDSVLSVLHGCQAWKQPGSRPTPRTTSSPPQTRSSEALLDKVRLGKGRVRASVPDPERYEVNVRKCQEYIREGESYELCLTGQTTIHRPRGCDGSHNQAVVSTAEADLGQGNIPQGSAGAEMRRHATPWQIFRALRTRQAAPFGSFIRLGGATIISSSPERFLTHDASGLCSMRPMKGTVRKSAAVSSLEQAEAILHVPKEEAENLMIVDLVRHDLHGVCGAQSVTVPDLLRVEEYATVFQMVTAVNGQLPAEKLQAGTDPSRGGFPFTGADVLASCLPPGSMTGAPKKRSCEILQTLEAQERSIYSGVVGYLDVQGRGDWSVTIRTLFRWDDEGDEEAPSPDDSQEVWRIGAGGAVTTLSTAEGEREEMFTKLCGPLGTILDLA